MRNHYWQPIFKLFSHLYLVLILENFLIDVLDNFNSLFSNDFTCHRKASLDFGKLS